MIAAALLAVYAIYIVFDPFDDGADWFFDNVITDLLLAAPAVFCFHRAATADKARTAWAIIAVALGFEALADVYWNAIIANQTDPAYPSPADFLYLAFYPTMALGLMTLALQNTGRIRVSLWLHVLIAVLAISALDAALVFDAVASTDGASGWEAAVNLAYPLGDVILLAGVFGVWALSGWRPSATWIWFCLGLMVFAAGDSVYLLQSSSETYAVGGLVDLSWPFAAFLVLLAATRGGDGAVNSRSATSPWMFLPTGLFSLLAISLFAVDHFNRIGDLAVALALSASILTIAQLGIAFAENFRLIARREQEALMDHVTGLPNRRKLFTDLQRACQTASCREPVIVALFDLDGFKSVNDALGHAAGDDLLARFGSRLQEIAGVRGEAYRLGGDEFCMLLRLPADVASPMLEAAAGLLTESGENFSVKSSFGFATVPNESRDADEALSIADQRMYAAKRSGDDAVRSFVRGGVSGSYPRANLA
ncbi:MAG: GGDEF domain-containing protein [Actinobacteria bacterium]|nr:GGDEF domain-containing protein [Actinomycetota bacterium]